MATPKKPAPKKPAYKQAAAKPPAKKPAAKKAKPNKADPTRSKAYRDANAEARSYAKDPERLRKLLEDATKKSKEIPRGPFKETWAYLMTMFRLIRAYVNGTYRDIPWQSLVTIVGAVIYFVSPIDFIPDWIPVVGYLDDAFVVGLAIKSVKDDLDAFMEWEAANDNGRNA